jgi:hypothetical protein
MVNPKRFILNLIRFTAGAKISLESFGCSSIASFRSPLICAPHVSKLNDMSKMIQLRS